MERIKEIAMRKRVDQVKRNNEALLDQYIMLYLSEGLEGKELEEKIEKLKKELGL